MDFRDVIEFIKDFVKYIMIAVIVLLLIVYVVSLQQVVGPSMNPNYKDGDILILNKLQYRFKKPQRFEVAVIKYEDTKFFIKRVIGLPGEKVEYRDGILYINDRSLTEKFTTTEVADFSITDLGYESIPEGYYLVVGDNRANSLDSRSPEVGLIPEADFIGKVMIRIWPFRGK